MATGAYLLPPATSTTYSMTPPISKQYEIWKALCKPLHGPLVDSNGAAIMFVIESNTTELNWASEFKPLIENLSEQNALLLFDALKDIFHPSMNNHERLRTIKAFLQIAPATWKELGQQIRHLLPSQSRGHDIMWVSETLAAISHQPFRDELVLTAAMFYTWRTESLERAYILAGLKNSCTTVDRLQNIQQLTPQQKQQLAKGFIPPALSST